MRRERRGGRRRIEKGAREERRREGEIIRI